MKYPKLIILFILLLILFSGYYADAQCSVCTKTASQMGEKPAKALNGGILYLMATPLAVAAYIGVRWWKREKEVLENSSE